MDKVWVLVEKMEDGIYGVYESVDAILRHFNKHYTKSVQVEKVRENELLFSFNTEEGSQRLFSALRFTVYN